MSEAAEALSTDEGAITSGFGLVRRGYDPQEVDAQIAWLEERLREQEAERVQAEAAAQEAAEEVNRERERGEAEANKVRDELAATKDEVIKAQRAAASTRPGWDELGGRLSQIFQLAEEEAVVVAAERTQAADEKLHEAHRLHEEAERLHAAKIRAAESQASEIVQSALAQAERIVREARQTVVQEEQAAQLRLTELSKQRSKVHSQLARLRDEIRAAVAPFDAESGSSGATSAAEPRQVGGGARPAVGANSEGTEAAAPVPAEAEETSRPESATSRRPAAAGSGRRN